MHFNKINSDTFIEILNGSDETRFGKFKVNDEKLIEVSSISLIEGVHLMDFKFEIPIVISSGNFENIIFDRVVFNRLIIFNGNFKKLEFRCCEFENGFLVYGGKFNGEFRQHAPKTRSLEIFGGVFNDKFLLNVDNLDLKVRDIEIKRMLEITQCMNANISIDNIFGRIRIGSTYSNVSIRINLPNSNPAIVEFEYDNFIITRNINKLEIGDVGKAATIKLSRAYIQELVFSKSSVQGQLFLSQFMVNDHLGQKIIRIIDSDLGYASFINCNFEDYFLEFENSKIINVFIAGTTFPEAKKINARSSFKVDGDKNKTEALSQLKKIFESKGDFRQANKYRAAELTTYYRTLNWFENFSEKSIVFLNKISSNHSQNWVQAFFMTIFISFVCFVIYCNILDPNIFKNHTSRNIAFFIFFEFVNPLHKVDFIPEKLGVSKFPEYVIAWENFSRVIIAFFIFQFVQAFRKFGGR